MKQVFVVLALVGLAFSAPQPRKLFHEHFDDFLAVIIEEVGEEIENLMEQYLEYEEFSTALQYMQTNNFKDLVYEMESLPEFIAVVDFLENDNIDIHFFIDMFNDIIESGRAKKMGARAVPSGTTLSSFIDDCIAIFPKDKLSALYDDKIANDEEFATAISNLKSDEWDQIFTALWDSETFQKEVQALNDNGIDVHTVLHEVIAVFGQY